MESSSTLNRPTTALLPDNESTNTTSWLWGFMLVTAILFSGVSFGQTNDCGNGGTGLTVGTSCNPVTFNSNNDTDYWNGAAGCNAADLDDAWRWFFATSTSTTIIYTPNATNRDPVLTLFAGNCNVNMVSVACADNGLDGDPETIVFATTVGIRYRIRIQDWNSNDTMNGTVCVYNSAPVSCPGDTTNFYDSGGPSGNYSNNELQTWTFYPDGGPVTATFTAFNTEVDYDYLYVYDGPDATSPLLGIYDGTTLPGPFTSTHASGTLTFLFDSDSSQTSSGWVATICGTPPPPITNDNCGGAISLIPSANTTCNATAGTTVGASQSIASGACGGNTDDDVWYSFVATSSYHNIQVTPGTLNDAVVELRSGACSGTYLACADNFFGAGEENLSFTQLIVGDTYYLRVYSYGGSGTQGTFDICITTPQNPCDNITNISSCDTTVSTTMAAGESHFNSNNCGFYVPGVEQIYSFTPATSGNYTISQIASFDWINYFYKVAGTCDGTGWTCIDDFFGAGTSGDIFLTAGTTYLFMIDAEDITGGNVQFSLNCPPAPPPNDDCINAIDLPLNATCSNVYGFTDFATQSLPGCVGNADDDVWYSFTAYQDEVTVTVNPNYGNMVFEVFSGSCGSLISIACINNNAGTGIETVDLTGLNIGDTYYIRVYTQGGTYGDFDICLTASGGTTTGVALLCPGDPSESLFSSILCSGETSLGNTITGNLNAATDLVAQMPLIFIQSADPCAFEPETSNYTSVNFTVNVTGTYIFAMETPVPYFDGMGYIVVNDGNYVPGSCATGTWIAGDDDDGPNLDPQITATLTAGVSYTLITTKFAFSNTTHTGPYTWNVTGPNSGVVWYANETGGSPIGTGSIFDPVGVAGSGLPDTNTAGVYSFWVACTSNPSVRIEAQYIIGKIWDGSESSDWNNANNWTPAGVPDPTNCVIIPNAATTNNDAIVSGTVDGDGLNLTIENNGNLLIESDGSLTIVDFVEVQGTGTFHLEDSASLIQVNDFPSVDNYGDITMDRTANIRRTDYVYWSSPVEDFQVQNISSNTPNGFKYRWIPTMFQGVGPPGNLVFGDWEAYNTGLMEIGRGYIVRGPNGAPYNNTTPQDFTATFEGIPNNGLITQSITSGDHDSGPYSYQPTPGVFLNVTNADDNWNLIGNPYPSALDAETFLSYPANSHIEGAIHIWTHGTDIYTNPNNVNPFYENFGLNYNPDDYITYNRTGTSTYPQTFNGKIASGQGFFIMALNNDEMGNVTFSNIMRDRIHPNNNFFRIQNSEDSQAVSSEIEKHRIWLNLISPDEKASSTLIGYVEGATLSKDRLYDANNLEVNTLNLFSKIGEDRMVIQGRPVPFDNNDQVHLGAEITTSGIFTIAIRGVDGLFLDDSQNIFLEDTHLGLIHNLRGAPYMFTVDESETFEDRFILRYTNETLGVDDPEFNAGLNIISYNNEIKVTSTNNPINTIEVYDILGRTIVTYKDVNVSEFKFNLSNISNGTFIVKATLYNGQQKVKKIVH